MSNSDKNISSPIPSASKYIIDTNGNITNIETGRLCITRKDKRDRTCVTLTIDGGEQRTNAISFLLAKTFIPLPDYLKNEKRLAVRFKDRDETNHSLSNLEWMKRGEDRSAIYADELKQSKIRHGVPMFDENTTGYYPNAVECPSMVGFYFLPNTDHPLVMSKYGVVFNLETQETVPVNKTTGYATVSICNNGKYITTQLHRLLGLLFIEKPERHADISFDELEINHKDFNKLNNALSNLEWVTPSENIKHSYSVVRKGSVAILARDIRTHRITRFVNVTECARAFGINASVLAKRLASRRAEYMTKDWHVFKYDNNSRTSWHILQESQFVQDGWRTEVGAWFGHNHFTKKSYITASLSQLCQECRVPYSELKDLNFDSQDNVHYKQWVFRYDESPSLEVIEQLNPALAKAVKPNKHIEVRNIETGYKFQTKSLNEAARKCGVVATTLSLRLGKNHGITTLNGFLFKEI